MEWFTEGVPAAIAASRQNKALFIVYVHDDIPGSSSTTEAWNSQQVQGVMSSNQAVAIKIAKGSLEHQQFSQIFPVFVFPSVFCIGQTGKPLVIMNGKQSPGELEVKLKEAFEKIQEELKPQQPLLATPTQSESPPTSQATPTKTDQPAASVPPSQPSSLLSSSPPTHDDKESLLSATISDEEQKEGEVEEATASARQESKEEMIERAQQRIREKRREREQEEFQKQKVAELKRREEGKELADSKKSQEDQWRQNWILERKKAKEEEKAAKEAILAKLRQDKLEREANKRAREQQQQQQQQQQPPSLTDEGMRQRQAPSSSTTTTSSSTSSSSSSGMCRVQLRLPAGTKSVIEMRSDDTLAMLRERVSQEVEVMEEELILSSTYPMKELGSEEDEETLATLGLSPSGVVLVRFRSGGMRGGGGGGRMGGGGGPLDWLWVILSIIQQFFLSIISLVKKMFGFGGEERGGGESDRYQEKQSYSSRQPTRSRGSGGGGGRGGENKTVHQFLSTEFDREDEESSDDEERRNTYNGNSTEQQ